MKGFLKLAPASVVALALFAGCATTSAKTAGTGGGALPASSASSASSPPAKQPDAKYNESCDMDLNSDYLGSPTAWLVGDAELHNTGNVGVVVRVKATWKQAGSGPITATKKMRLAYKKRHAVHFKLPIGQNQVDAVQSAPGYLGSGHWCGVKATLVSTFGAAH